MAIKLRTISLGRDWFGSDNFSVNGITHLMAVINYAIVQILATECVVLKYELFLLKNRKNLN